MIDDYLALERLLIDRLKAEAPDFRDVLGMADLAAMQESSQITPAAHVIYRGDVGTGNGSRMVGQIWWVVIAVRNERDTLGGSDARLDAGPLITKTLKALNGWMPTKDDRRLKRVFNTPPPGFNAGFGYFPLAFKFDFYTEGTPCESN